MTYQQFMFVGLVLCFIPLLGYVIAEVLRSRWEGTPHFVSNRYGGVYAVCSLSDFLNKHNNVRHRCEMVRETLAFGNARCPVARRWAGGIDSVLSELLLDSRTELRLYVPFASCGGPLDYHFQAEIFKEPPRDIDSFIALKRRQNYERLFRFRFLDWWSRYRMPLVVSARVAALLCVLFFTGYVMDGIMDPAPRAAFMKLW